MKHRKKLGRPKFNATPARREFVEILRASGFSEEAIAVAIGCDAKTLRARFRAELDSGSIKINARIAVAIFRAAEKGNSAAAKIWRAELAGIERAQRPRRRAIGKKALAEIQARSAAEGTSWSDLVDVPIGPDKPN